MSCRARHVITCAVHVRLTVYEGNRYGTQRALVMINRDNRKLALGRHSGVGFFLNAAVARSPTYTARHSLSRVAERLQHTYPVTVLPRILHTACTRRCAYTHIPRIQYTRDSFISLSNHGHLLKLY